MYELHDLGGRWRRSERAIVAAYPTNPCPFFSGDSVSSSCWETPAIHSSGEVMVLVVVAAVAKGWRPGWRPSGSGTSIGVAGWWQRGTSSGGCPESVRGSSPLPDCFQSSRRRGQQGRKEGHRGGRREAAVNRCTLAACGDI